MALFLLLLISESSTNISMAILGAIEPVGLRSQEVRSDDLSFAVAPLSGTLGAEIDGIDLSSPPSQQTVDEISSALARYKVLVFRDQELTAKNLVLLGRCFGELHQNPFVAGVEGWPEIMPVRSEENHEKQFTGLWHSDISWSSRPSMGSLLYAVEIPPQGGDTLFANMHQAWSSLSPGLQRLLSTMRAEHRADRFHSAHAVYGEAPENAVIHPVVTVHPETGERVLFVNEYFTSRFEGLTEEESRPLLDYLFRHSVRPDFTCRVRWQPKTLVFWDNRSTIHYATNDYAGYQRLMHRVTVNGVAPVGETG